MAHIDRTTAERILSERGWLPQVPEDFRGELLKRAKLIHVGAGEPIFHLGDPAGGIYGLASGTVSISIAPEGETPRLVVLGIPGHWTGEACFLTRKPRRGDLRAIRETTLLHLPLDVLDQMAAADPHVAHHVAQILVMSVEFALHVIHDLQKPEPDRRIAAILQRATWSGTASVPITQSEVGVMANASRKQVNAALKRFAEAGWVTNTYRSITVIDAEALRRVAAGDGTD